MNKLMIIGICISVVYFQNTEASENAKTATPATPKYSNTTLPKPLPKPLLNNILIDNFQTSLDKLHDTYFTELTELYKKHDVSNVDQVDQTTAKEIQQILEYKKFILKNQIAGRINKLLIKHNKSIEMFETCKKNLEIIDNNVKHQMGLQIHDIISHTKYGNHHDKKNQRRNAVISRGGRIFIDSEASESAEEDLALDIKTKKELYSRKK